MRVLINYATYADRITIHCLADDARTVVAPFKKVSSPETLYCLIRHVGGDAEQCRVEIAKWGHGGCWADVKAGTVPVSTPSFRGSPSQAARRPSS